MRRVLWFFFLLGLSLQAVPPSTARPIGEVSQEGIPLFRAIARSEAAYHGVPFYLVDAVMWVESSYNPAATGGIGEVGLMQILPSTARMPPK